MNVNYITSNTIKKLDDNLTKELREIPEIELNTYPREGSSFETYRNYLHGIRDKPDIMHLAGNSLAPIAVLSDSKTVVTVHDPPKYSNQLGLRETSSTLREFILRKAIHQVMPYALSSASKIVTISDFVQDELADSGFNRQKMETIHWGVDSTHYRPIDSEYSRKQLGLPTDKEYVLAVGSNIPRKRWDIIHDVMVKLSSTRGDLCLLKAGYGEMKDWGDIDIINTGYIPEDDMPFIYNSADVMVNASEFEGFGMPILESMACRTPVIASNQSAIKEVTNGIVDLVDIHSENHVDVYVELVRKYLSTYKTQDGALERAKSLSWNKCATRYAEVYKDI
jgi:glycosyltransferase involved in cell wall biosynthesis